MKQIIFSLSIFLSLNTFSTIASASAKEKCISFLKTITTSLFFTESFKTVDEFEKNKISPNKVIIKEPNVAKAMAELGYIRGETEREWNKKLYFLNPNLIPQFEQSVVPYWVEKIRNKFHEHFNQINGSSYNAGHREQIYATVPENFFILTARSISDFEGRYSFVLLADENFLRLGMGHHMIGAKRPAQAAGEIVIVNDPKTGLKTITELNARSDTYRPDASSLIFVLESLWRQGIYSRDVKILSWDRKTVLLDLQAQE